MTTWIYGLARRWAGRGVTANLLDPGIVKGKSGSEQYVRLAADPALAGVSGMYFVSGKEKKEGSSPLTLDPAVQKGIDDAAGAWTAPFLRGR